MPQTFARHVQGKIQCAGDVPHATLSLNAFLGGCIDGSAHVCDTREDHDLNRHRLFLELAPIIRGFGAFRSVPVY